MLASLLDRSGNLQRQTAVQDAIMGNVPTWATVTGFGTFACAVGPATWRTTQEFQRPDMVVDTEIYSAVDIGAKINDRIIIDSKYYLVLAYKPFVNPIFGPACYVTVCGRRNQS